VVFRFASGVGEDFGADVFFSAEQPVARRAVASPQASASDVRRADDSSMRSTVGLLTYAR
jgi:hypothetical protein